jgi:LysM repeat protein
VASGDTCQKIVDKYGGFSLDQFYGWNPAIGTDCSGLWVDYYVCVGVPGTPTTTKNPTTTTAPSGPSPTQDGIISTCKTFYKVASGDTCQKIVDKYGTFALTDFYNWNPAVGSDCSGLWVGYYVCVGLPSTPTTTNRPTTTTKAPSGPSPTQDGIVSTCKTFYKVASGDTCQKIVDKYGTFSLTDFYNWNPAVGRDCSGLWVGYYVCVGLPSTPTTTQRPTTTTKAPSGPTPTQDGIISSCNAWYQAKSGDACQKIVDQYKTFSLSDFYKWNPAVGVSKTPPIPCSLFGSLANK